ncbi:MAG: prepilin-type N-terminal cleavage/methylation domain-containing protein [candidate division Zixibacteria bacterium]|nr:prepilin-type N-terminal cleavage/methylation domain-containing protein [candidate division Zixibacteria bacterium]
MKCEPIIGNPNKFTQLGFTLIELVIIIVILGIVSAVAIPKFGTLSEEAKANATREEIRRIKTAIIGDPQVTAGGEYINRGFEGDIGYPPANLVDLIRKPDSIATYDKFTRLGWNGPYLDSSEMNFLYDSWDNLYTYDAGNRTVESTSPTPNITVTF